MSNNKKNIQLIKQRWNDIKTDRLRKLNSKTKEELLTLLSSIPKSRFEIWCNLNKINMLRIHPKQIFYQAIIQSWIAHDGRDSFSKISFHRELKADVTERIYQHLFRRIDPKLEIAEEICKYLD